MEENESKIIHSEEVKTTNEMEEVIVITEKKEEEEYQVEEEVEKVELMNSSRRRNDIKKDSERRANLDFEDDASVAPENSYIINECSFLRYLICWWTPLFFWGLCHTPRMKDLPQLIEHAKCHQMEKRFDYIWPKLKGVPFRLMIAINYCFGVEFWIGGFIMVLAQVCLVVLPKVMQRVMELLFFPYINDVPEMEDRINLLRKVLPRSLEVFPPPIEDITRENDWEIWAYIGLMMVLYLFNAWGTQYCLHIGARVGMQVRSLLITKIYQKSLRLSNKARNKWSNGVIMNHCTMDSFKIERIHLLFHTGWTSWIILIGSSIFLIDLIDWATLSGMGTNIVVIPVMIVTIMGFFITRICALRTADKRVSKTNEVLQSIGIIKFFSWERSFEKKIKKLRFIETLIYRAIYILFSVLQSILMTLSNLVCMVAFLTFYFVHEYLDTIKVFTALTYFNAMKIPLGLAPMIITVTTEMLISMVRIQGLLEAEEIEDVEEGETDEYPIVIEGGTFKWESKIQKDGEEKRKIPKIPPVLIFLCVTKICQCLCLNCMGDHRDDALADPDRRLGIIERICCKFYVVNYLTRLFNETVKGIFSKGAAASSKKRADIEDKKEEELKEIEEIKKLKGKNNTNLGFLEDINIKIKKGELVMIIGRVGSGKSSLLYAMLGEMKKKEGDLRVTGSLSFTSQLSWIQNETLYQNVVFGEPEDQDKWEEIVDCCQLQQDLEELKGGQWIEIGEKGINLSGGQKYRVQLARACYSPSDIVLLDDPLAAVDAHVGKKIFHQCIIGYLKERTRVLVTHQLNYLEYADHIILMDEGKIAEQGTFDELMDKRGKVFDLRAEYGEQEKKKKKGFLLNVVDDDEESNKKIKKKKKEEEEEIDDYFDPDIEEENQLISEAKEEAKINCQLRTNKRRKEMKERMDERQRKKDLGIYKEEENKIIQHEELKKGVISPKVFFAYFWNMGCCAFGPCFLIFGAFTIAQIVLVSMDWWLTEWTNLTFNEKYGNEFHVHIFVGGFTELSDGGKEPHLFYFDPVDYPPNMYPALNYSNPNVTNNPMTPPPVIDNTINCTKYISQMGNSDDSSSTPMFQAFKTNLPTNEYSCPSILSWCGCNDMYLPVFWEHYDNGTKIEDGITHIASISVYIGLGLLALFLMFARTVLATCFAMNSSLKLHHRALRRVVDAPMSFFDTTPIGRIITRFAFDMSEMDGQLVIFLVVSLGLGFNAIGMLIFIIYNTDGWGAFFVIPLLCFYFFFYLGFRKTNLEFKRLESVSKAHYLAHLSESLNGTPTIRAYRARKRFSVKLQKRIDLNNRAYYVLYSGLRWTGIWLGVVGCIFVFLVLLALIIFYYYWDDFDMDKSYSALAISYSIISTQMFFQVVQLFSEAEAIFNSVERLDFYAKNIPIEEPFNYDLRKKKSFLQDGKIEFKNYSMRYRPGLELVLKNLNFTIKPNERIGIVGRTGSGKSSLMIALWRIVEPSSGKIMIDDYNIKTELNLTELRSKLSIIPQSATLFSGTIRSNLDPFSKYTNGEVWQALKRSFMKKKVESMSGRLNGNVKEGGANFSVGERQLLCLARALLRNSKILVLDECTASVDVGTDTKIQKTIRESFDNCTTLTIAHRLETIIDSDRILVMNDGVAAEFDTPRNLLADTEKYCLLRDLVHETGESTEALLYEYAFGRKKIQIQIDEEEERERERKEMEDKSDNVMDEEKRESDDDDSDSDDSSTTDGSTTSDDDSISD